MKWQHVGDSVYALAGDLRKVKKGERASVQALIWREGREWHRTDLPPATFQMALASIGLGPGGLFAKTRTFDTFAAAKRGRK